MTLLVMTAAFSLLMVAPIEYPKLSNFRGASPAVLVLLEKDGCPPMDVRLKRAVSGWIALDLMVANPYSRQGMSNPESQYLQQLALGLPLTFGPDLLTGGAYKLPKVVDVRLCASPARSPERL